MLWKVLSLNQVRDIDADRRWQVDFPIDDEVINILQNSEPLDHSEGLHELSPVDELERIFLTDPIDGHIRKMHPS
jgi:hypothetical protein